MSFEVKEWVNRNQGRTTPLDANALKDLEKRLSDYADSIGGGLVSRVATLESDSPLASVIYAEKYLEMLIYANPSAALQAAIAALPALGGKVVLPAKVIDPGAVLDLRTGSKEFELEGAGRGATFLRWTVDLGAGQWAIRRTNNKRQVLRNLTVLGPTTAVINGANASMWGIEHLGRNGLDNIHVQGFKAGIVKAGDHGWIRNVTSTSNRDGIYYEGQAASGLSTWGNHYIDTVDVTGNSRSGIAFASDGHANGADWRNLHLGMGPTGLYWEVDGSNNAALVQDITFSGCTWENCGNALFYSASATQAGVLKATFIGSIASQVFASGFVSPGLRNQRAHLDGLAAASLSITDGEMFPFAAGPIPGSLQYGGYQNISINEGSSVALSTMISANAKPLSNPLAYQLGQLQVRERVYARQSEAHYCDGVGITAGRLVYRSADGGVKPWVAGKAVYGVALQTGAAFDFIMVGREGIFDVANSATTALAVGNGVIPDGVTADGKVTIAGGISGASIGSVVTGGTASSSVRVDFSSGWRF